MIFADGQKKKRRKQRRKTVIKVYGYSDDIVEVDGGKYPDDEIGCYDHDVHILFKDGTVIRVGYPKPDMGVWWIRREAQGYADQRLTECNDPDADVYSDVFEIDSEVLMHTVVPKEK